MIFFLLARYIPIIENLVGRHDILLKHTIHGLTYPEPFNKESTNRNKAQSLGDADVLSGKI
jgi:hypothetical protein